jgi:hypothetical protein
MSTTYDEVPTTQDEAARQQLYTALAAFQAACPAIPKGRTATIPGKNDKPGYSYHYAALEDIAGAIRQPLADNGLAWWQDVASDGQWVSVTTTVAHVGGASFTTKPFALSAGSTPQAAGSSASYGRRYSLSGALGIVTEEDDDGAGATHSAEATAPQGKAGASGMSDAQRKLIQVLAQERGMDNPALHGAASAMLNKPITTLTVLTGGRGGTASQFIEHLKQLPKLPEPTVDVSGTQVPASIADEPFFTGADADTDAHSQTPAEPGDDQPPY